jgi:hypothetical protein
MKQESVTKNLPEPGLAFEARVALQIVLPVVDWASTPLYAKLMDDVSEWNQESEDLTSFHNIEEVEEVLEIIEGNYSSYKR